MAVVRGLTVAGLLAAALLAGRIASHAADNVDRSEVDDWLLAHIGGYLQSDQPVGVDKFREHFDPYFTRVDVTGLGVAENSYRLLGQLEQAQWRALVIKDILLHDLDGDGVVTRAELENALARRANLPLKGYGLRVTPTPRQVRDVLQRLVTKELESDTNNDGVITYDEMRVYSAAKVMGNVRHFSPHRNALPTGFDVDGDGIISRAEFDAAVTRVLAAIDTDADGSISIVEAAAARFKVDAARTAVNRRRERERR